MHKSGNRSTMQSISLNVEKGECVYKRYGSILFSAALAIVKLLCGTILVDNVNFGIKFLVMEIKFH